MSDNKQKTMSSALLNAKGPIPFHMTNDYLFKALLQKNTSVLKAITCSLLKLNPETVRELKITNPIILGERIDEKDVILDVNVEFQDNTMINLEMQVQREDYWPARSLYYTIRNAARLSSGDNYDLMGATFHIGFLDFQLFEDRPIFYDTCKIMSIYDHHIYTDLISIGYVDLTNIELATEEDQRYNVDKWARFFKCNTWEDIRMLAEENVAVLEAAETVYEISEVESRCRSFRTGFLPGFRS